MDLRTNSRVARLSRRRPRVRVPSLTNICLVSSVGSSDRLLICRSVVRAHHETKIIFLGPACWKGVWFETKKRRVRVPWLTGKFFKNGMWPSGYGARFGTGKNREFESRHPDFVALLVQLVSVILGFESLVELCGRSIAG